MRGTSYQAQAAQARDDLLDCLASLVAFDTQNPPRAIRPDTGLLAWYARQLPSSFRCQVDDHGDGCVSLLAVRGAPTLLFNVHIDTVPATAHWQRDPFVLAVESERALGLGACDIKGAAACLLTVAHRSDGPMAILLSSDEEAGDNRCISRFLASDHGFERVVVAEPTRCEAVLAHRGIVSMRATFSAAAGHSSEPRALADNALHQAARWLAAALDWAQAQHETVSFEGLSGVCFNAGTVSGGIKNNMIAPTAQTGFGLRPLPGQDAEALVAALRALHRGGHPVDWRRSYAGPALPSGAGEDFAAAMARSRELAGQLALPTGPAVNFWTEAALFSAAGLPALVFGPGDIAQAHCADEWVALAQLETACAHYLRIVDSGLADGGGAGSSAAYSTASPEQADGARS